MGRKTYAHTETNDVKTRKENPLKQQSGTKTAKNLEKYLPINLLVNPDLNHLLPINQNSLTQSP